MGIKIRFTTNPAASFTSTGVLPRLTAIALTWSTSSRGVLIPAMTSTSFITGAGLKKCMPTRGLSSFAPISVMDREEVLEAKMQVGLAMA